MLMPAAVLIVLLLGAIAVDLTVIHLHQRAGISAAGSAANDAVTFGLDQAALRRGDGYHLDPDRVQQAVLESIDAQGLTDDLAAPPRITMTDPDTVTVELDLQADYIFARALPRGPRTTTIHATATATADQR
ncbi:MAG: hypothetical protein ACXWCB_07015 [Acidimicrobiales bacterium]